MSMPGPMEWVLIFLVILLLFGAKRIPEIMKSFGEGVKEFKKGVDNITDSTQSTDKGNEPPQSSEPENKS